MLVPDPSKQISSSEDAAEVPRATWGLGCVHESTRSILNHLGVKLTLAPEMEQYLDWPYAIDYRNRRSCFRHHILVPTGSRALFFATDSGSAMLLENAAHLSPFSAGMSYLGYSTGKLLIRGR